MGALVVDRELTVEDAVRAALPLDVLLVCRALARGARLRRATHPQLGDTWQLEQLAFHADERLRWGTIDLRTAKALVARDLIYVMAVSARGTWTYYGLTAAGDA